MFYENLSEFDGKPVRDFVAGEAIDPDQYVYRLRLTWEDYDTGLDLVERIDQFAATERSDELDALVIGAFTFEMEGAAPVVQALAEHADRFAKLRTLFFGDITYEEQEVSWIMNSDMGPLLAAYPQLEELTVRGDGELRFSTFGDQNLRSLILQTGGLSPEPIADVLGAELPALEKLEMWLGSEYYGFSSSAQDFAPLFAGDKLPKLTHLGLMNAEITDELVAALSEAPILDQIEHLDVSKGTLTDTGAQILSSHPGFAGLKSLAAHHHFVEDLGHFETLQEKGVDVSQTAAEPGYDDEPYCQVSE